MKYNTLSVPVALFLALFAGACSKGNTDKRDIYVGAHLKLTGTAKFVNEWETPSVVTYGDDTASFTISKVPKKDSADYIYIKGVYYDGGAGALFVNNGVPVIAQVVDTGFVIPRQLPYSGGSLSIEGYGAIKSGKLEFYYSSYYRGYGKYSTVMGAK